MYTKKTQQTRTELLDAFIELLKQKDISQISVIDIVNQAQVHRATFYRHFEDKFDLIQQAETDIFQSVDALFEQYVKNDPEIKIDTAGFNTYRVNLLHIFMDHADFITVMLGPNGDLTFENALYQKIYQLTELGFQTIYKLPTQATGKSEFIGHYAASAAFGVVRQWLKNPTISAQELSNLLDELTIKGLATTINDITLPE
ncbi:TetR/AcrR family transcriptional regulator [Weissella minor]|uniref:TetR/AcrR family transcriptional regulator n=1 Tax=Weissella minor TaxID=1620 RepID=UPI001BB022B7|nr:TetR/AcrR family transcriptional regulator [Weissella minor]MBS0949084.1 TetR/AcrR family transcriptional regulator [Weissella minor]